MAMGKCLECGRDVSTDAPTCPGCGKAKPTTPPLSMWAKIGAGFFVLLLVGLGGEVLKRRPSTAAAPAPAAQAPAPAPKPPQPAVRVPTIEADADAIWREYHANEVRADAIFKGKVLLVHGFVASVDKNAFDQVVVRLRSPNPYLATMAHLEASELAGAAQLKKGQKVTMVCVGSGMVIGTPSLDACIFR